MTARGYYCFYLEHCSKTNHVAIKGGIKRAKYENGFWTRSLSKTCWLVSCTAQNVPISTFVKIRLSLAGIKCLTSKIVGFRWRVQKNTLWLQRYDLEVEYKPGKNLFIADTLSRAPEVSNETTANKKDEFEVLTLENLRVSEVELEQFKDATRKDLTLQKLKTTVISGWSERKSQVDPELRAYWNIKEAISMCDEWQIDCT